jgi:hypothetical protein
MGKLILLQAAMLLCLVSGGRLRAISVNNPLSVRSFSSATLPTNQTSTSHLSPPTSAGHCQAGPAGPQGPEGVCSGQH